MLTVIKREWFVERHHLVDLLKGTKFPRNPESRVQGTTNPLSPSFARSTILENPKSFNFLFTLVVNLRKYVMFRRDLNDKHELDSVQLCETQF